MNKNIDIPTNLVILGATGDLMGKKIVPALFHLFKKQQLPKLFSVIGVSRQKLSDQDFQNRIIEILAKHKDIKQSPNLKPFLELFRFVTAYFKEQNDYLEISQLLGGIDSKWKVCSNKLFYLAVPTEMYKAIFKNLVASGLTKPCSLEEGWTRVIVEKPFGKDFKTAQALESLLSKLFREIQIYRIDHYLAKEMLQNILAFRFSNNLFEQSWNRDFIEKIEIRLWEKLGVENRGSFYDGLGALRDVGQNHLLQMLALVTMKHPVNFSADAIRDKREEILKTLITPSKKEVKVFSFRAQYDGYRVIAGTAKDSTTETYFKTLAFLSSPKWQNVPIVLESGKRLKEQRKEIAITFKHPTPCLCPSDKEHYKNRIVIQLEPKEQIIMQFWSKKPGLAFEIEERDLSLLLGDQDKHAQYTEEYEKLLLDCIAGNQTLFVSSEEVKAMWRYIDPIIQAWDKNVVPLKTYALDTDEPIVASLHIDSSGAVFVQASEIKKEIGIIGLGKMGSNLARRLIEAGWRVVGYNKTWEAMAALEKEGLVGVYSLEELVKSFSAPRLFWLMVPAGKPVDEVLFRSNGLVSYLEKGDIVIDGGNSFYKDSVARFKKLREKGIHFIDVGVSGGPAGARGGASLMIGGTKEIFERLTELFQDLSVEGGYAYMGPSGAGHFVKMIHNGIEYGMMQAIAEGFAILKNAKYRLDLTHIADVYNHGSVIESRLVGWLKNAIELRGDELKEVSDSVGHTGEGAWTVKTAKELKIKATVIEKALKFRIRSAKNPSFTGKVLSALREQFGGHSIKTK